MSLAIDDIRARKKAAAHDPGVPLLDTGEGCRGGVSDLVFVGEGCQTWFLSGRGVWEGCQAWFSGRGVWEGCQAWFSGRGVRLGFWFFVESLASMSSTGEMPRRLRIQFECAIYHVMASAIPSPTGR